ncbi:MAG TPA: class I SAM-dependent methyltransferase [Bacteroidia bacterium]
MNSKVFDAYSSYYDLLYQDKNYEEETRYVHSLIKSFSRKAISILELGCGTGIHASMLSQMGFEVHGIDQSKTMLAKAAERKISLQPDIAARISFEEGDIRSYKSNEKFDVVIALFHVMSYMETDNDLANAIETAIKHLKKGSLFIFDCWHGPAVLHDKPVERIKDIANNYISVKRKATPELFPKRNIVEVNYEIIIQNKKTKEKTTLHETHKMRYLFTDEIKKLIEANGAKLINAEEWMSKNPLSEKTWNACYMAKR